MTTSLTIGTEFVTLKETGCNSRSARIISQGPAPYNNQIEEIILDSRIHTGTDGDGEWRIAGPWVTVLTRPYPVLD